jgi:16S rRNA (cytosine967-C5)-methyltransferase
MSLYQMWHMDRVPDHALVHDAVEISKQELQSGTDKFVNAVLRRLSRDRPWGRPGFAEGCPDWVRVSLPRWLWERWVSRFGVERAKDYALSLNLPPRAAIRFLAASRNGTGVDFDPAGMLEPSGLVPGAILAKTGVDLARESPSFSHIQDEASQLIPFLFGPLRGLAVWDVCAAPGGKSAILRELCGEDGWVVSTELHFHRARRLRGFLAQWEGAPSFVLAADASTPFPWRRSFDAVLVDAPCSGLGTMRRNPEIKWRICLEDLRALQQQQSKILHAAACSVRAGGRLLYATCSTEAEENEEVVASFLSSHPDFALIPPSSPEGVERWVGDDSFIRTFPTAHLWDGFFAALLVRK